MTPFPPDGAPAASPSRRPGAARRLAAMCSLRGRYRVLHLTTLAFFLTFVVWFDMAPFLTQIAAQLHLSKGQVATLTLANLALAIPGRIAAGTLVDRFGPRRVYGTLLICAAVPNTVFAVSSSFGVLVASRLALGAVGAGFVVGVRMIGEWFGREEIGVAEGLYGGWGNAGSAAAALVLPGAAMLAAGQTAGWRWGMGVAGLLAAGYGVVYLLAVRDTPDGREYERPPRPGAAMATSRAEVWGLLALLAPPVAALGLVAYRIELSGVISSGVATALAGFLVLVYLAQAARVVRANRAAAAAAPRSQAAGRPLRPVALLSGAYFVTFGAELAAVSVLPAYFATTFGLGTAGAAAAGSAFALTNLVTRPGGGLLSDLMARRRTALAVLLAGAVVTFCALSLMNGTWQLWASVALVALASVSIQGGNGAVYAMVPLVSRRSGGQVAGLVGAYGNVGGLVFTSVLAFDGGDASVLFLAIAGCAAVMALLTRWIPEPFHAPVHVASAPGMSPTPARAPVAGS